MPFLDSCNGQFCHHFGWYIFRVWPARRQDGENPVPHGFHHADAEKFLTWIMHDDVCLLQPMPVVCWMIQWPMMQDAVPPFVE